MGQKVKIKSLTLYLFLSYSMLVAFMIGPTLSYRVGLPRIDNPMTLLFIILSCIIFFLARKEFPKKNPLRSAAAHFNERLESLTYSHLPH